MLGVGGIAPTVILKRPSSTTRNPNHTQFQKETHKEKFSLFSLPNHTQFFPRRNGLRLFAQKKPQQSSSLGGIELDERFEFGEFDDEFDFEDEFFDEEEDGDEYEDDDDDLMLPLEKMDEWLKKKPKGFGDGKVYDTSIEDKLMEEIEQSRAAQLANVSKLKKESKEARPQRDLKASGIISSEIRVRINNLPKKKNVLRDLRLAFQGVRGLVSVSPVVSGNKKTRDPVCKGFGFVDFKSLDDANRFVQTFSGQSIAFGRIQKQIKCEILKSRTTGFKGSVQHEHSSTPKPKLPALEDELGHDSDTELNDPLLQLWEDDNFDEYLDDEDDFDLPEDDGIESESEPDSDLSSLRQIKMTKGEKKKSVTNRKSDLIPQLSSPGSATRLKVREKDSLSDVISRYEVQAPKEIYMDLEEEDDQNIEEILLHFLEEDDFDENEDFDEDGDGDDAKIIDLVRTSEQEFDNPVESNSKPSPSSAPSMMHNLKTEANANKSEIKLKPEKIPKLSIKALAKMLNVQDVSKLEELVSRLKAVKDRSNPNSNIEEKLIQYLVKEDLGEFDGDDFKFIRAFKQENSHSTKINTKAASDSSSSPKHKHKKKTNAPGKRSAIQGKTSKIPKLKIPGSAKRLKGQDKVKLADVFTKYGAKEVITSKGM